ncbi:MAG TPA: hypothetical protein PKC69_14465 [Chitinophagaceae bacterium]|nr:hypothetical protein [Chitinophagaceae bacterium]
MPCNHNTIRQKLARLAAWVLLLCFANTILDPGGMSKDSYYGEDLAVNDMESIYEWVLEDLLDRENAIPESDEQDIEKKSPCFTDWVSVQPEDPVMPVFSSAHPFCAAPASLPLPPACCVSPPPEQQGCAA